jgi:predicted metalloprotease with PDZ domain
VTDDKKFAHDYFEKFINGHEPIDYSPLLAQAGFRLVKAEAGKAWIGSTRSFTEKEGLLIEANTQRGTPVYEAGLDVDDKILAIDNQDVRTLPELNAVLERLHPGAAVSIRYLHRSEEKTGRIVLGENPVVQVQTYEAAGQPLTPQMIQFRKSWLGAK